MTERILAVVFVFIKSVIAATGYGGIVILMAIESACVPLPSELIMPFAGYLVYEGTFRLLWVATVGAIGCNLGSLVAYEIGCYGGRPLVEKYGRWILMGRRELDWADRFFARWGYLAVFIARLLPVIRTFIALPAGVARMPRGRFHLYTFLGSWPWCLGLAWLGMKLGENWRELGKYFQQFDAVIGAILVAGVILSVWSHLKNRMSNTTEDGRWDYRVTIVFRNAAVANEAFDEDALKKQLFPDQETYQREEQRRFEILDAHWDLPLKTVDLEAR